jgi:FlaA1/EpsC-like NDP-sugar epimerase
MIFTRIKTLAWPILQLPRAVKQLIVMMVDLGLCVFATWLAFYLRIGEFVVISSSPPLWAVLASSALVIPIFVVFGLYRAIFRYSGLPALTSIAAASLVYGFFYMVLVTLIGIDGVPRTIGLIQPILLLLLATASRVLVHFWFATAYQARIEKADLANVLVYGAGQAGRELAAAVTASHAMRVVGFLDDNPALQGAIINGIKVYQPDLLGELVATKRVQIVLLALPLVSRVRRNEILNEISKVKVQVRTLPSLIDLVQGKVSLSNIRDLDADDLLGRDAVPPDPALLCKKITGKTVLITGAGGSIGSELCRQVIKLNPNILILLDHSEYALYTIQQELDKLDRYDDVKVLSVLGSVVDRNRLQHVMSTWKPATIFHAAAYKHVPMVEENITEGIKNNVFGTLNVAKLALTNGVSDLILISTDKAVRPANVMGASKRLAEMVLQAMADLVHPDDPGSRTVFSIVRFGNVLGSSGSVVPKFRQQIRGGGPLTLTHRDVTRYFMTIPEAAQLVIQASAMAESGGEVYILDMGEPVRIEELAVKMIEMSGLTVRDVEHPEGDIEIKVIGLRPGEKLYEELLIGTNPKPTRHPQIMKADEAYLGWKFLNPSLGKIETAIAQNNEGLAMDLIQDLVEDYIALDRVVSR